jgi:hypothetical protein
MEPVSITRAVVVAHWYYFLPQYALAVLMWTMAGRFLLGMFAPPDWDNYVWRFFRRLTDPVIAVVRQGDAVVRGRAVHAARGAVVAARAQDRVRDPDGPARAPARLGGDGGAG